MDEVSPEALEGYERTLQPHLWQRGFAAGAASAFSSIAMNPLDIVKVRYYANPPTPLARYQGNIYPSVRNRKGCILRIRINNGALIPLLSADEDAGAGDTVSSPSTAGLTSGQGPQVCP